MVPVASYNDEWFRNHPDCHKIGTEEKIVDGRRYTKISYLRDLTPMQRIAQLIVAVVATILTAVIGLFLFEGLRGLWIEVFTGEERVDIEEEQTCLAETPSNEKSQSERINILTEESLKNNVMKNNEDPSLRPGFPQSPLNSKQVNYDSITKEEVAKLFSPLNEKDTIKSLTNLSEDDFKKVAKKFSSFHFLLMRKTQLVDRINLLDYDSIDEEKVSFIFPYYGSVDEIEEGKQALIKLSEDNFKKVVAKFNKLHFPLMNDDRLTDHLNHLDFQSMTKAQVKELFSYFEFDTEKTINCLLKLSDDNFKKAALKFSKSHFSLMHDDRLTHRLNLFNYHSMKDKHLEELFPSSFLDDLRSNPNYDKLEKEKRICFQVLSKERTRHLLTKLSEDNFNRVSKRRPDIKKLFLN